MKFPATVVMAKAHPAKPGDRFFYCVHLVERATENVNAVMALAAYRPDGFPGYPDVHHILACGACMEAKNGRVHIGTITETKLSPEENVRLLQDTAAVFNALKVPVPNSNGG